MQYIDLHFCLSAAGARCVLINSPNSVNLDNLLDKEAIILSAIALTTLSQDVITWLTDVQQFLERYPTHITSTTIFQETWDYPGMTLVWVTD